MAGGDSIGHIFRNNAEVIFDTSSGPRWSHCDDGCVGKWALMWARMALSDRWKEQERKSAMVLDAPGTDMTRTFNSALRETEPRWRRRKVTGAMEEVEPRDAQATAGVLSQPIHRVELCGGWEVERAWVWATIPRSSRSE